MANHIYRFVGIFKLWTLSFVVVSMIFATTPVLAQTGPTEDDSRAFPPIEIRLKKTNEKTSDASDPSSSPTRATSDKPKNVRAGLRSSEQKEKQFADQFWTYLLSNNYKHWSPLPGKPTEAFATQSMKLFQAGDSKDNPHTRWMKVYMNRTAATNLSDPPIGSVLVTENLREDQSLESISVMYRTEGFNPQGNDWYWVNYNPDGSVTTASFPEDFNSIDADGNAMTFSSKRVSPIKLMGRATSCMACHQKSTNSDFAFFNDRSKDDLSLRSAGDATSLRVFDTRK